MREKRERYTLTPKRTNPPLPAEKKASFALLALPLAAASLYQVLLLGSPWEKRANSAPPPINPPALKYASLESQNSSWRKNPSHCCKIVSTGIFSIASAPSAKLKYCPSWGASVLASGVSWKVKVSSTLVFGVSGLELLPMIKIPHLSDPLGHLFLQI